MSGTQVERCCPTPSELCPGKESHTRHARTSFSLSLSLLLTKQRKKKGQSKRSWRHSKNNSRTCQHSRRGHGWMDGLLDGWPLALARVQRGSCFDRQASARRVCRHGYGFEPEPGHRTQDMGMFAGEEMSCQPAKESPMRLDPRPSRSRKSQLI